jgi:hypothetical protein
MAWIRIDDELLPMVDKVLSRALADLAFLGITAEEGQLRAYVIRELLRELSEIDAQKHTRIADISEAKSLYEDNFDIAVDADARVVDSTDGKWVMGWLLLGG